MKFTSYGQQLVQDIANRHQLSVDSVSAMLDAICRGGGTMAQFQIQELGGSGQWMQGGMTMVGDMFNYGLKSRVVSLCNDLAPYACDPNIYEKPASGIGGRGNWWPQEFGSPNSSGAQNNVRYAYFAGLRRLVVDLAGDVWIYNTLDHNISGVSQQQGGGSTVTFTSQYGTVNLSSLPVVQSHVQNRNQAAQTSIQFNDSVGSSFNTSNSQNQSQSGYSQPAPVQPAFVQPAFVQPAFVQPAPPQPTQQQTQPQTFQPSQDSATDAMWENLRKLGDLHDAGIVTPEEFQAKKTELLSRL